MPKEKKYGKRVDVFISPEQFDEAKKKADDIGISVSAYLRMCAFSNLRKRQGNWRQYEGIIICSECQAEFREDIKDYCGGRDPNYCMNCGADMTK